jgi:hypothetical protein
MAQKWEYRVQAQQDMDSAPGRSPEERLQSKLSTLGGEGWDLVTVRQEAAANTALWIFKRRVEEELSEKPGGMNL